MSFRFKVIAQNSFLALLVSSIVLLMVYGVRAIIDPMFNNPELIKVGDQISAIFIWTYNLVESHYIGYDANFTHRFDLLWTPIGILLNLLYISLIGNIIYLLASLIKTSDKHNKQ